MNHILKVYAVFKQGVYRHECGGVFSTPELACDAANSLINGERDDYHDYHVVCFEIDQITPQSCLTEGLHYGEGSLDEKGLLYIYRRKSKEVIIYRSQED